MEKILAELMPLGADFLAEGRSILWYFLAGVALEATVRTFGWHIRLRRLLGRYTHGSIFLATGIGMFSPLCACGVLPLTISMLLSGVPLAPAMTLLVASPLMSPAGYTTTLQNLGQDWALAKLFSAAFMGLFAGYVTLFFQKRGGFGSGELFARAVPLGDFHDPDYACEDLRCSCRKQFSKRFVDGRTTNKFLIFGGKFVDGFLKIGKFVILGVAIEVLALRYIPLVWVTPLLTNRTPLAIPLIAFAAIPLHVNQITASFLLGGWMNPELTDTPIQIARGPGLAFLVGGPVTALPVIAVFLTFFRKRVFFLYLGICLAGTIGMAYAYQYLIP